MALGLVAVCRGMDLEAEARNAYTMKLSMYTLNSNMKASKLRGPPYSLEHGSPYQRQSPSKSPNSENALNPKP